MHAISWQVIDVTVRIIQSEADGVFATRDQKAVRIREWAYTSKMDVEPRPLYLIGQTTLALGGSVHTRMPSHVFLRVIWLLMQMEITAMTPEVADRHGRKRARNLFKTTIHVIRLRRAKKPTSRAPHRDIDWSCTWIVRGHWRKAPHGSFKDGRTRTWIAPYLKGPDGQPLHVTDVLYRLSQ
jgi:hypothetical protein